MPYHTQRERCSEPDGPVPCRNECDSTLVSPHSETGLPIWTSNDWYVIGLCARIDYHYNNVTMITIWAKDHFPAYTQHTYSHDRVRWKKATNHSEIGSGDANAAGGGFKLCSRGIDPTPVSRLSIDWSFCLGDSSHSRVDHLWLFFPSNGLTQCVRGRKSAGHRLLQRAASQRPAAVRRQRPRQRPARPAVQTTA